MKGGRTAPRNLLMCFSPPLSRQGFNEGGADCPPKHRSRSGVADISAGFNEGGADCPPKRHASDRMSAVAFASMKGGRTAPRNSKTNQYGETQHKLQ